uniref:Uncharacterized protein n=1 Tax=Rhizophora mucronata TaxID=61149 RepID=A0A2P2MAG5_RHIMU
MKQLSKIRGWNVMCYKVQFLMQRKYIDRSLEFNIAITITMQASMFMYLVSRSSWYLCAAKASYVKFLACWYG